jgi:adenylosuccinate lyase
MRNKVLRDYLKSRINELREELRQVSNDYIHYGGTFEDVRE